MKPSPGTAPGHRHAAIIVPLLLVVLLWLPATADATDDATPPTAAEPFAATQATDLRTRITRVEDRILILTPAALYRFLPDSEAWTMTTTVDGLPEPPLANLSIAAGNIWISGDGTSVSDQRFDDWQHFGTGEGYPGRVVYDVEADEDYAYAGTDAGAARFDQYILEWETLSGPAGTALGPVIDVAVGDDRVWLATERSIVEYRKETESFRADSLLGQLQSPKILALRQSGRFLLALTDAGIARYDKELQSWVSFQPGVDLPDARVHQFTLQGDDLWLGTDDGLWSFRSETGIWRRDESNDEMPGLEVQAFTIESDRIWVVTERAFAIYERDTSRWVDFGSSVPLAPDAVREMAWIDETLMLVSHNQIVYGLGQGLDNPSLFTYRSRPILESQLTETLAPESGWQVGLDEAGLGLKRSANQALYIKGGATIYVEDHDPDQGAATGLGEVIHETRMDLTLNGRVGENRTLSGFYDTTVPDNSAYQLTYRGARADVLRLLSVGEIEQQLFNSNLVPGTGLRGGRAWTEFGGRSETTRRRFLTGDAWGGERRTLPGRDIFYGDNRSIDSRTDDTHYVPAQVFPLPTTWMAADLRDATLYLDDGRSSTDDANTEHRILAGTDGAWDRLDPNLDYVLGPGGETVILAGALGGSQLLVAVSDGGNEVDLSDTWLRNHYFITTDPVPGSLAVTIVDSTGAAGDATGMSYLERFGLDQNGDGLLDPERFSPVTGMLSFPTERPFPTEVYEDLPLNIYTIEYAYQASVSTFGLSHRDLVPQSESIKVDRALLKPDVDYSIIPTSGLFILFEHVLLDDDTVIEVEYLYEVGEGSSNQDDDAASTVIAGQLGVAPNDHLYCGVNATSWSDDDGVDQVTAGLNTRLEWKGEDHLLRLSPELAFSKTEMVSDGAQPGANGQRDWATGIALQGRHRNLEVSASHRNLGGDFTSFEDRRTLLGRLREESTARGRLDIGKHLQAELEWDQTISDGVAIDAVPGSAGADDDSLATGRGEESLLTGTVRLLHSGWPNLELRRGRIVFGAPGWRQEKQFSRAELELSPDQAGVTPFGIRRLWLRAFFQRSERELESKGTSTTSDSLLAAASGMRTTDHTFVRLNGSVGTPFSWNLSFEDRRTFQSEDQADRNLRRLQGVDATLQTQPHSSVDAFLRWESSRDLFWHPEGKSGGFGIRRLGLATVQLYPGRVTDRLARISFRLDLGNSTTEDGEPGTALPGAGSLWTMADEYAQRRETKNGVVETRIQLMPRLRLVERWERDADLTTREDLRTRSDNRRLESRLEYRPHRGLAILRFIGATRDEADLEDRERRFSGQWDQAWGRGFLTYVALETKRNQERDRDVGETTQLWNPSARLTWRRARWQFDASLGGALTWTRTKDTSLGATGGWHESRQQALTSSVSLYPHQILALKLQYAITRNVPDPEAGGSSSTTEPTTDHDLRLRIQIRA